MKELPKKSKPMKVFLVAGARPNFMKIAPLWRESRRYPDIDCRIVHTGQHYDHEMSQAFFEDLELPRPDFFLDTGSGSHATQTAKIMIGFEEVCEVERPDLVVVVGDVNSTLACSIVAKKQGIKVAHVEAGLRSYDLDMPEEINRMVTDSISDLFFVTEQSGIENLLREGKPAEKIHHVGHVMIDNLYHQLSRLNGGSVNITQSPVYTLKPKKGKYLYVTLHRPSNVDDQTVFNEIANALNEISREKIIIFPVHPRTKKKIGDFGIRFSKRVSLLPPLGFKESLFLWKDAEVVLTDSGGLQEETTALGIPCVTIRENTERPITVQIGTNVVAGMKKEVIIKAYHQAIDKARAATVPEKWDGKAAERIWRIMANTLYNEG
jgi:UDP-N-acetylglucosamine 2-epimerase (non-hydrolysing)